MGQVGEMTKKPLGKGIKNLQKNTRWYRSKKRAKFKRTGNETQTK